MGNTFFNQHHFIESFLIESAVASQSNKTSGIITKILRTHTSQKLIASQKQNIYGKTIKIEAIFIASFNFCHLITTTNGREQGN